MLCAWERRCGLLRPVRSSGEFRLYTAEEAERVVRMRRGLDQGLPRPRSLRRAGRSATSAGLLEDAAARLRARLLSLARL